MRLKVYRHSTKEDERIKEFVALEKEERYNQETVANNPRMMSEAAVGNTTKSR